MAFLPGLSPKSAVCAQDRIRLVVGLLDDAAHEGLVGHDVVEVLAASQHQGLRHRRLCSKVSLLDDTVSFDLPGLMRVDFVA
ncbi:MAG: hypothetical protein Q8O67_11180 [Deltaproteobacteria bacterium]|nr:hypothetical protein [Deltaproteobacteria bacterium]